MPAAPSPPPEEEPLPDVPEVTTDPEIESFLAELDKISAEFERRTPKRRTDPTPGKKGSDDRPDR